MDGFTPASLQLLQQSRPAPVTWGQLGGLQLLRRQLVAALQRPLQYPCLHARAGRPPQPRALLYGPPGTGKTLLARALADNSDINFFTVKGPELLSKYIGASEMAVRDLFERASRASPAIIFFDEFESLAPRRGHDSTGVTDRVVNQLLTLLDGAETPSGGAQVALLAASSRPDLLDPALLRPGRIGRLLRCPLPDAAAGQEILCALTRDVPLAADVQWSPVVARTGGLTGADLRALVADAQLRAVRETLTAAELTCGAAARSEQEAVAVRQVAGPPMDAAEARTALQQGPLAGSDAGAAGTAPPPAVAWRHVEAALADLRPSLSVTERRKYEAVYEQFERGRGEAGGGAVQSGARPRQRVSLA